MDNAGKECSFSYGNMVMPYDQRTYRSYSSSQGLVSFVAGVQETDLFITALSDLSVQATTAIQEVRTVIEDYIQHRPEFETSLAPLASDPQAHELIQAMLDAGSVCNVGPMAAVAGTVAEYVSRALLDHSSEIIVENGGDLYLQTERELTIGIFAGPSPLSEKVGLKITPQDMPLSLCTSSGTVGPSLSMGQADAVTVRSRSAALADAAATALANTISQAHDIPAAIQRAQDIEGLDGIVIVKDDQIGAWGDMELVALETVSSREGTHQEDTI